MFFIHVFISLVLSFSFSQNLFCELSGNPEASKLIVEYSANQPRALYLKRSNEDYRKLSNIKINVVFPMNSQGRESFSVTPTLKEPIQWGQEVLCFKQTGTQWYFIFDHTQQQYRVDLMPYYEVSSQSCIPPRVRPQTQVLNCE